ncbi:MAG: hypothetical protein ACRC92_20165 [Peptostreptococcaceae bacterium]
MSELEALIQGVQNQVNAKQSKISTMVLDSVTINQAIDVSILKTNHIMCDNMDVKYRTNTGTLVSGGTTLNGSTSSPPGSSVSFSTTVSTSGLNTGHINNSGQTNSGSLQVNGNINSNNQISGSTVKNAVWN